MLKEFWYFACKYIFYYLSDRDFFLITTWVNSRRLGFKWYKMDLESPRSFTEKVNYLKLKNRNPLAPIVADKVRVRSFVENSIGSDYLIPLIGVYNDTHAIPFGELPKKFALKTSHGSGWNLICKDKSAINWSKEKSKLDSWLHKNAFYLSREWQYKEIPPKLICEELLEYEINDYKIYCTKGLPKLIQVDTDRFSGHRREIFDLKWQRLDFQFIYPVPEMISPRPPLLQEMLEIAAALSSSFIFCRIDLYVHEDQIFFGEVTLHPEGGNGPFRSFEEDLQFAEALDLNFVV